MPYNPILKASIYTAALLLYSCAGLKPAQINAVEKYTIVTKGITAIPQEVYRRVYQLRSQSQSLQLSGVIATNEFAKESIEALQLDLNDKIKFINLVDSFAYAYKIVGKYADLVHSLLSQSYLKEFSKNKKEWQSSFDGLVKTYNTASVKRTPPATKIPPSVGSVVANVINELGSAKIKSLQKKYLKQAISTAREPFEGICDDFLNTDMPKIRKELVELPSFINANYKDFLNNIKAYETKQGNNPYNYYKLYLPIYLNWQIQLSELNILVNQLEICIRSLRNSYGVLDSYIGLEKVGKDIPPALQQLDTDYYTLLETITKFADAREKLFKITY